MRFVSPAQAWSLLKAAFASYRDDYAPSMGAALAYYTLFSIAPLLLIVISVAGLAFGEEAARGEVFAQLAGLIGEAGAKAIEGLLDSVNQPEKGALGTLVGVVALLVGATTVFAELQDALDRIWRAPARERGSGVWTLLRARLLSFGMILGLGFLMIVSLVLSAGLAAFSKWWSRDGWEWIAQLVNFVLSFGFTTAVFAMIYKVMPRVRIDWHDVWIGAIVTSLLFSVGKFLIGLYIGTTGVASGFGAAGSIVVLLVWVYWSAQIFLLGAEFTWVYAHQMGSRRGEAIPKPQGVKPAGSDRGAAPIPLRGEAPAVEESPGRRRLH